MLSLKDFKEFEIEVTTTDLIYGGISCSDAVGVLQHLHNNHNEQLGNLCGKTIQCTGGYGSLSVADDCCSFC